MMKKIPRKEWSSSTVGSDGSFLDDDDFIVIDSAVIFFMLPDLRSVKVRMTVDDSYDVSSAAVEANLILSITL